MLRTPDSRSYFFPTDELLTNPHIGFQTFQRFNGDELNPAEGRRWTEGLRIEYQDDRGTRRNEQFPDTTVAYFRVYWRYFEPEEGVYNWDLIDKALRTARSRGQTLMLRLAPYGSRAPDGSIPEDRDLPEWMRKYVGPIAPLDPEMQGQREAYKLGILDTNNPAYAHYYARVIRTLARHYDNDPRLDSVDLSVCGPWGENAGIEWMHDAPRNQIIHAYLDNFTRTPLQALCHNLDFLRYLVSQGKGGVGFRADCLGDMSKAGDTTGWNWAHMLEYYPYSLGQPGIRDMWRTGPISFESCGVMYTWWDNYREHIDYIIDQSLAWHISTFNAKSSPVPPEWMPNVERWLKKMGYRFALRNARFPGVANPGDSIGLDLWLENRGVAPIYRKYPLCVRVKGGSASYVFDLDADIREALPGDYALNPVLHLPDEMPAGAYSLQLAVLDPLTREPNIRFACDAPREDGWYVFGSVNVEK